MKKHSRHRFTTLSLVRLCPHPPPTHPSHTTKTGAHHTPYHDDHDDAASKKATTREDVGAVTDNPLHAAAAARPPPPALPSGTCVYVLTCSATTAKPRHIYRTHPLFSFTRFLGFHPISSLLLRLLLLLLPLPFPPSSPPEPAYVRCSRRAHGAVLRRGPRRSFGPAGWRPGH